MASKRPSLTERALQLSRTRDYEFVYQIERQLKAEGYPAVETTFDKDPQSRKTLREIIKSRRTSKLVPRH